MVLALFLVLPLPCRGMEEDAEGLLDEEELSSLLAPYLEKYGATEENFSLAFTYTGTGESYYLNGDKAFYAASLYKVPLCMIFAEKVSRGELSYDSPVRYRPLGELVRRTLEYSDNDTAGTLYLASGAAHEPYALAAYSGMEPEELPKLFRHFYFTSRFMLATLQTLYDEPDRFPRIVEHLKKACPEHYFRASLENRYEVAQKNGQYEGVLHNAGIIYTPTPILLVVMCDHMPGQLDALDELAEFFADYSLELDKRQAQREAEKQEEAARAKAQSAPSPTATPLPTPEPAPVAAVQSPGDGRLRVPALLCLAALLSAGATTAALRGRRGK